MILIYAFLLLITFISITMAIFNLNNEFFPPIYAIVTLVCLIPLAVALGLFIVQFRIEDRDTRFSLVIACILVIISTILVLAWHLYFIWEMYEGGDDVHYGTGPPDAVDAMYFSVDINVYVYAEATDAALIIILFTYFTCVSYRYYKLYEKELEDDRASRKAKMMQMGGDPEEMEKMIDD
mgnify:CR=1 FL=1